MKISPTIKVFRFPKSRAEITDVQLSFVVYSFSFVPPEVFMSVCVYKFMLGKSNKDDLLEIRFDYDSSGSEHTD